MPSTRPEICASTCQRLPPLLPWGFGLVCVPPLFLPTPRSGGTNSRCAGSAWKRRLPFGQPLPAQRPPPAWLHFVPGNKQREVSSPGIWNGVHIPKSPESLGAGGWLAQQREVNSLASCGQQEGPCLRLLRPGRAGAGHTLAPGRRQTSQRPQDTHVDPMSTFMGRCREHRRTPQKSPRWASLGTSPSAAFAEWQLCVQVPWS